MNKIKNFFHTYIYTYYTKLWVERFFKIKSGQTVVDAGAYLGGFTLYAAKKVGHTGKIIAFEPNPTSYKILVNNIKNAPFKQIVPIQKALGDKKKLVLISDDSHFSSVKITNASSKMSKVLQTTLDDELKELIVNHVDLITMNIEGAEIEAVNGARKILKQTKHIAISSHLLNGKHTAHQIDPILRNLGFKTKIIQRKLGTQNHIDLYGFRE